MNTKSHSFAFSGPGFRCRSASRMCTGNPNNVRSINRVPVRFDQGVERTYQEATAGGLRDCFRGSRISQG